MPRFESWSRDVSVLLTKARAEDESKKDHFWDAGPNAPDCWPPTLADIWRAIFPDETIAPLGTSSCADTWVVGQTMTRSAMVERIVAYRQERGVVDEAKPPFGQPFGA